MSVICLEGPDLAGKTTIAQWQQAELIKRGVTSTYIKRGPIREDPMIEYLYPLNAAVADPRNVLILDRWHVGELIYGPLLRGRSVLTERQADYLEMVLQSLGCAFIHATAPISVLEDRYDIRGDSLIKREWLHMISGAYWHYVATRPHWASIHAPTAMNDPNANVFAPTPPIADQWLGRYLGPRIPSVLLLGDMRASDEFTWPFVPRRATSGHWLMGTFHVANVDHMRVGIVNACEQKTEDLYTLWNILERPPIVTLGRNAERAWRMADPGFQATWRYLHHPQYQRRFHYQSFVEYGQVIKDTMR